MGFALGLAGCTPPGPRSALRGEKLIQQGQYPAAIASLENAARLLPKEPQVWNHLGLAYHLNRQPAPAINAYRRALMLDHRLASTRYNLGCLLVEQGELPLAIDYLTSYTMLEPRSINGWLRLAGAQVRARRLEEAERGYRRALEMDPRHPEALNGLGVIHGLRKRPLDALAAFGQALQTSSNYGPALLNSAIITQQGLNNRPMALAKYRQYLALQPRPTGWEAVAETARQLELALAPPAPPTPPPPSTPAEPSHAPPAGAPASVPAKLPSDFVAGTNGGAPKSMVPTRSPRIVESPAKPAPSLAQTNTLALAQVDRVLPSAASAARSNDVSPAQASPPPAIKTNAQPVAPLTNAATAKVKLPEVPAPTLATQTASIAKAPSAPTEPTRPGATLQLPSDVAGIARTPAPVPVRPTPVQESGRASSPAPVLATAPGGETRRPSDTAASTGTVDVPRPSKPVTVTTAAVTQTVQTPQLPTPASPPTTTPLTAPPPGVTAPPAPVAISPSPSPQARSLEVTHLPDDLAFQPARDLMAPDPPPSAPPAPSYASPAVRVQPASTPPKPRAEKRSLFAKLNPLPKLNPFAKKPKAPPPAEVSADVEPTELATPEPPPPIAIAPLATPAPTASPPPSAPRYARYSYQPAHQLRAGHRTEATRYFQQALAAHRNGDRAAALRAYQNAAAADPSYYDAHYNLGLAHYEAGEWPSALRAFESALTLRPDSADSRYNFALTLKQAQYPLDAAAQFLTLLESQPSEVRAHLALGNLYAQQLRQPQQARAHYARVLELDPHHPQAAEIRYWLAANP